MKGPKHIQLQGFTDIGCVRHGNEDCFIIQEIGQNKSELNPSKLLDVTGEQDLFAAVSDGMGGAAAGEVASQTALGYMVQYLSEQAGKLEKASAEEIVQLLEQGVHQANREIFRKAQEFKTQKGMGATITALYLKGDTVFFFQIGDSRAYVLRENKLIRLTRDQSFVGHLVEMGTITEEQAMRHPQRNVILQALGTQEKLKVDISYLPLCKGDLILLCSDGLYGEFLPEQLERRVQNFAAQELDKCIEMLIEEAKTAGGKDNITVIGIKLNEGIPEREPGEEPRYRAFADLDNDNPLDKSQSVFC